MRRGPNFAPYEEAQLVPFIQFSKWTVGGVANDGESPNRFN